MRQLSIGELKKAPLVNASKAWPLVVPVLWARGLSAG